MLRCTAEPEHCACSSSSICGISVIISLAKVGGGVLSELICTTHGSYTALNQCWSLLREHKSSLAPTERRCSPSKLGQRAECAYILLGEGVLDSGDEETPAAGDPCRLERGGDGVLGLVDLFDRRRRERVVGHAG